MSEEPTIFIVDDDGAVRESLALTLKLAGYRVRPFPSALDMLAAYRPDQAGCLLLDQRMPGMSGLELQKALAERGSTLPVIFLSAYGDVPTTVLAVKRGAVDFLEKPVTKERLLGRIEEALAQDRRQREEAAVRSDLRGRLGRLSAREREVMLLATKGLANKEIARHLGISPRTVENHRARLMRKLHAESIAELCQIAAAGWSNGDPSTDP
ncbi:MAG: response regulator [Chromatiaceae bacterium]|jgi:RNA polymerase sigma factor (sigma-70 family)|nr:response regulator [Chromatiaceae bacterium]